MDSQHPKNTKDASVLVWDNGLFHPLGEVLVGKFKHVFYYTPWQSPFPLNNNRLIGDGIPGVTRIDSPWDKKVFDAIDLFVFVDVFYPAEQLYLESVGKLVWGARSAEIIETDRLFGKQLAEKAKLFVGPYKAITGITALRAYLKGHDGEKLVVKISDGRQRGHTETAKFHQYWEFENKLDEWAMDLGLYKDKVVFIVETMLEGLDGFAVDTFTVDGQYAQSAIWGLELKGEGYEGVVRRADSIPTEFNAFDLAIAPGLKQRRCRSFYAAETLVMGKGQSTVIDPCLRLGFPPAPCIMRNLRNLADVLYYGAQGIMVKPVWNAPFVAQINMYSPRAETKPQPIKFPPSVKQDIFLRNAHIVDGNWEIMPRPPAGGSLGAAVGIGNTLKEAQDRAIKVVGTVEGPHIEYNTHIFDDMAKTVDHARAMGFADAMKRGGS